MQKMQDAMMKRYKVFAVAGLLIVLAAFLLSLQAAGANLVFFSVEKAAREAAAPGSNLVAASVTRHSIATWVPSLKFLGLGLMLGAITMALGIIARTLRELGSEMMSYWPADVNPGVPARPRAAKVFPMLMMMGWVVLLAGLILALWLNSTVAAYWANTIATDLNPAGPGSLLLAQLGLISGVQPWVGSLRFMGMALLFTAVTVALTVILRTLQAQEISLRNFVQARVTT